MKLSTKGRYGTKVLLELALHYGEGLLPLKDIARRQQIPLQYLAHLIAPLITGGILRSTRGARGGISLTKPPRDIRLDEVIQLLEGSITPVECVDHPEACNRSGSCTVRDVWGELQKAMTDVLESITLQDLVERHKRKELPEQVTYCI